MEIASKSQLKDKKKLELLILFTFLKKQQQLALPLSSSSNPEMQKLKQVNNPFLLLNFCV